MVAFSTRGLQADAKLFNSVVGEYYKGDKGQLNRLMLEQYNWTRLSSLLDGSVTRQQSRRLTILYVTLIKIADAITGKGEYNLKDDRENEVVSHRGWYIKDFIFPDIIKKDYPDFGDTNTLFNRTRSFLSLEYGVVQSIITAQDLQNWTGAYNDKRFVVQETTSDSYFGDAQQVFKNIVSGRSIVLLTNDALNAFREFLRVFADTKNPAYKPEYTDMINQAQQVVRQDVAEYNQSVRAKSGSYDR